jgi:hypothetical protein
MASTTPNIILLATNGEQRPVSEGIAHEAITPGQLVRVRTANGKIEKHGTAGGPTNRMFALENPYIDPSSTKAINTNWAADGTMRYVYAQSGDVVYAWLADGQNVTAGAPLQSNGAGALTALTGQAVNEAGSATYTISDGPLVGFTEQALDNSAGGAVARIKVRIA